MKDQIVSRRILLPDELYCEQLLFHPSDDLLVALESYHGTLSFVDCQSAAITSQISCRCGNERIDDIAFDASGRYLIAIAAEYIQIYDLASSPIRARTVANPVEYDLHEWFPTFSANGDAIWALFADRWQLWSASKGELLKNHLAPKGELLLHVTQGQNPIAVTYDAYKVNSRSETVSLWDVSTRSCIYEIVQEDCRNVVVSPDAKTILIGDYDQPGTFAVWDTQKHLRTHEISGEFSNSRCEFCHDNLHAVFSASDNGSHSWSSVLVANVQTGNSWLINPGAPYPPPFRCSPYAPVLATVWNARLQPIDLTTFWDPLTGRPIASTTGHVGISGPQLFSPNGNWFATSNNSNSAEVIVAEDSCAFIQLTDLRTIAQHV